MTRSRAAEFDALYRANPDPWRMADSAYEHAKYEATMAALPPGQFASTLEVGCSIGVLSRRLATRSDRFLGIDVSEVALATARERNGDLPHARFERAEAPSEWPRPGPEGYTLIVLSEILYFLERPEVEELAHLCARDLAPGGTCLLVNWTGPCDLALDGAAAAKAFLDAAAPTLVRRRQSAAADYRIDLLRAAKP